MKKFLIHTGIIIVTLLAIMWGLDKYITNRLQHSEKRMFAAWNDILFDSTNYNLLILGSSRAWQHYDTRIIDSVLSVNCYNLGLDGKGLDAFVSRYRIYRHNHIAPRYAVLNLDLCLYPSKGYEREQYLPYFQCANVFEQVQNQEDFKIQERILPLVRYAGYNYVIFEGLGLPSKLDNANLNKGYGNGQHSWNGTAFNRQEVIHMDRDSAMISLLKDWLQKCNEENIKVFLVASPTYTEVFDKIPVEEQNDYWKFWNQIAEEYHCELLDFSNGEISRDTANFANAMHLNKRGAELFTKQLVEQLKWEMPNN